MCFFESVQLLLPFSKQKMKSKQCHRPPPPMHHHSTRRTKAIVKKTAPQLLVNRWHPHLAPGAGGGGWCYRPHNIMYYVSVKVHLEILMICLPLAEKGRKRNAPYKIFKHCQSPHSSCALLRENDRKTKLRKVKEFFPWEFAVFFYNAGIYPLGPYLLRSYCTGTP